MISLDGISVRLSIILTLLLTFVNTVVIWLARRRERNEAYTCDWMECSFSTRVNRTFREHLKLYLSQYVVDKKKTEYGEAMSQEPPGSYFVPVGMSFV